MAKEETKDFNAMLHRDTDMPKIQIITDPAVIQKYGGEKMYFAPPLVYDEIMRSVPRGKLLTVGHIRAHLARKNGADFTDPITAGIFVSIAAWASHQRQENKTPYWRTLKAGGELNANYPGGREEQRKLRGIPFSQKDEPICGILSRTMKTRCGTWMPESFRIFSAGPRPCGRSVPSGARPCRARGLPARRGLRAGAPPPSFARTGSDAHSAWRAELLHCSSR